MGENDMQLARQLMVEKVLKANGIRNSQVLNTFATVPRHEFVSAKYHRQAYWNQRLSIGYQQTMLSPLIMAQMLEALRLSGAEDILEVGTGSGYLTALLTRLGSYVFSLEKIPQLAEKASYRLQKLKQDNVDLHIGDGSQGLADMASFDVIVITGYVQQVPRPLALQLHPLRGRMLIPVGDATKQSLKLIRREANHWYSRTISTVQLPRLKGRYGAVPPSVSV